MTQPLIGISGSTRRCDGADRAGVNAAYVLAVARSGGIPLILTPAIGALAAGRALDACHGLVLTGGHDIDPQWYHGSPSPALGPVDRGRDEFDLTLFRAARSRRLPVLGICRGMQIVNVAMGGTLWQDLPSERPGDIRHDPPGARNARTHAVTIEPESGLADVLGTAAMVTNSFHHQAVRDLGPGLCISARADDGVIEGIEGTDTDGWLLAVQWHPEEFHHEQNSPDQRLFEALIGACRAEVK